MSLCIICGITFTAYIVHLAENRKCKTTSTGCSGYSLNIYLVNVWTDTLNMASKRECNMYSFFGVKTCHFSMSDSTQDFY